ncbi:MAG: tRNA pseudouridine(38-40) synthase TruA [Verrucomicrobia bacterium]|nr:tRNA pseudouridine(38-40) synthase TruA [Verrucomicrobiota bacterium]
MASLQEIPDCSVLNLKVTLAYDGGAYVGWQRQAAGISVQQRVEDALRQIGGRPITVNGASRTDRGVHALGMVANFHWPRARPDPATLLRALNALLPADIRVLKISRAAPDFHARFNARWKLYRYRILSTPIGDPFRRTVCWLMHAHLNVRAMRKAARFFVGRHDFSSVAVNPGYERASMVRHIRRCVVRPLEDEILVEVEADGFLYKMVRTIVGTLVETGLGKRAPETIRPLLESCDRRLAGKTAPAHGLFLARVRY